MTDLHRRSTTMIRVLLWASLVTFFLGSVGCANPVMTQQKEVLRERIAETNTAFVEAVAPLFDAKGRSPSAQGRAIEESLSRR